MRVAQIIPGSGTRFYCENCMRDGSFVKGLHERGHEVIVASLYLPLSDTTMKGAESSTLFYGAVNLYLQHSFPVMRNLPSWAERVLDSPFFLRIASNMSGSTDAAGLEDLTISMLQGEAGGQAGELDKLIDWLHRNRPDIVHLSNGLLIGLARRIKQELHLPVVCSLQDEDTWIQAMEPEYQKKTWQIMQERISDVDLFLPVSRYYAQIMQRQLSISSERMCVVPIGIDVQGYPFHLERSDPPVVGFLAQISESKGIGNLIDAFILLQSNGTLDRVKLKIIGGAAKSDLRFIKAQEKKLAAHHLLQDVEFVYDYLGEAKYRFLESVTLLSVPVLRGEAFGFFILEAMASGIPVVQPRLGGFPEVIEETGCGVLFEPNDVPTLARTLKKLLLNPSLLRELGNNGSKSAEGMYSLHRMVLRMEQAYALCLKKGSRHAP